MGKETKKTARHSEANTSNIFMCKLGGQHNTRGLIRTGLFHQFPHTHYHYTHQGSYLVCNKDSASPSDSGVHQELLSNTLLRMHWQLLAPLRHASVSVRYK